MKNNKNQTLYHNFNFAICDIKDNTLYSILCRNKTQNTELRDFGENSYMLTEIIGVQNLEFYKICVFIVYSATFVLPMVVRLGRASSILNPAW